MIPIVSICIITYNHEKYILQAIEGVLMQETVFQVEIIIHDDASTDNTTNIIKEYALQHSNRIYHILQSENQYSKGINPVVEFVFPKCQGKYIAICEGDDYWTDPYKLQKQVDFLEKNTDFSICFHNVKVLKDGELVDNTITKAPEKVTSIEELSKGNFIHTCSSLFRYEKLRLPKWHNSKLNAGDYPLHLLLATRGKIFYMEECMGVYRIHSGGIFSNAKSEVLLKGNVYLLKTLIDNFENQVVRKNLRVQLVCVLEKLKNQYINNEDHRSLSLLKIKNIPYFKKDEVLKAFFSYFRIQVKGACHVVDESFFRGAIKKAYKKKNKTNGITENSIAKSSFSQCGEDLIVKYIFELRGISKPSYIDIGANDPYFLSNTALFYSFGSRGINIEANPNLIGKFKKFRPEDVNLNIGIGAQDGEMDFYIMNDPTLSSFDPNEIRKLEGTGKYKISETKKINVTTLNQILLKYNNIVFPDFMSLDVEGMDFDILKSIDFTKNSPKVICVEAAEYSPVGAGARRNELIDFLSEKGYYEYANTNLNAIMVRRDFWFI